MLDISVRCWSSRNTSIPKELDQGTNRRTFLALISAPAALSALRVDERLGNHNPSDQDRLVDEFPNL